MRTLGRPVSRWACAILLCFTTFACEDDDGDKDVPGVGVARSDGGDAGGDTRAADTREVDAPMDASASDAAADAALRSFPSTGAGGACDSCERSKCGSAGGDYLARCLGMTGQAAAGPGKDMPRARLCAAILACARSSGCAAADSRHCYCGAAVNDGDCAAGKAAGACKAVIEAGAEAEEAPVVLARLYDPNFAAGNAVTLLEKCDRERCFDPCLQKVAAPMTGLCPPPPCRDLDDNCTGDCRETLATNAGFKADGAGWQAEAGVTVGWDTRDGDGDSGSGALALVNARSGDKEGAALAGAQQCVPVGAGKGFVVAAQIFIAAGQTSGSAGVGATFYPGADCGGTPIAGEAPVALAARADAWSVAKTTAVVPPGARSLAVRLLVAKPFRQPPLRALFDNVLVAAR